MKMSLKVYAISSDNPNSQNVQVEDFEIIDVLGRKEEALAVKIEELFSSVISSIGKNLQHESELTVEVTGTITLKGEAGAKWLFFNVGSSATQADVMKVILKTKINPHEMKSEEQS